jgi:ribosome-associated protein
VSVGVFPPPRSFCKSLSQERRTAIVTSLHPQLTLPQIERIVCSALDNNKAKDIVTVDLAGKANFADAMVIATGTSARHVASLAEHVVAALKSAGAEHVPVEGHPLCDWVLVDAGDVLVHIFRPEVRGQYNLEKMWTATLPQSALELAH